MIYKIKEIRELKGISQEDFSKKSTVSRTIISGLENGAVKNTTASTIAKIAEVNWIEALAIVLCAMGRALFNNSF
ncbi:MAG: helix-turn-helix transcriptional regulator [Anaerorhabdus sp.]